MEKITLQDYLLQKQKQKDQQTVYRQLCSVCLNPDFSCYCSTLQTFNPQATFVILIHPLEYQRRIATGRMSHLILQNSILRRGQDFSNDERVNELIQNPENQCLILYPKGASFNLSQLRPEEATTVFPQNKKLVVFLIDGTWATARQMMRQSQNLHNLLRVALTPTRASTFRVRKQPNPNCISTIEAAHLFLETAGKHFGFNISAREHDHLISAFDMMVEKQILFSKNYECQSKRSAS